jgi:hypothetical protein
MLRLILISIVAILTISVVVGLLPDKSLGRDLQCTAISDERARIICQRLESNLHWTWMGHAIISPGWRVTFETVRITYCAENIGPDDIPALVILKQSAEDWRAESGADLLVRLVHGSNGAGHEDSSSIFNPENPSFILSYGCA